MVIDGQHTSTGDTTENVGTGTLEQRANTFGSDNLLEGIEGRLILDSLDTRLATIKPCRWEYAYLARSHHHATTDGIKRI